MCSTLVARATWKGPSTSAGTASLMSHCCNTQQHHASAAPLMRPCMQQTGRARAQPLQLCPSEDSMQPCMQNHIACSRRCSACNAMQLLSSAGKCWPPAPQGSMPAAAGTTEWGEARCIRNSKRALNMSLGDLTASSRPAEKADVMSVAQ